jgi:c-di-GMP phosphodiesterase
MREHTILGQVALGYSPMLDRRRDVVATRLTVFPERPDAAPDAAALLAALEAVWPRPAVGATGKPLRPLDPVAEGASARTPGSERPVVLNIAHEGLLQAVLAARPPGQFLIEVPAFMATDPAFAKPLTELHAAGSVLMIKGRPLKPLAPEVLACFAHSLVDVSEDRRVPGAPGPAPGVRKVTTVQTGVRSSGEAAAAFERGAVAVLGWAFDEIPPGPNKRPLPTDVTVVLDLIKGVERDEPVAKLEAMLKRDPTVAFRLMRYLNSPAFGLSVEISSFGHAVMLLGHQRLKRWLALLLASSSKEPGAKATMHAAVRRGLLMEELARSHNDPEMSGEMFICGVFSLLDKLLRQPASQLLDGIPVPERVRLALLGEGGPYLPYLQLVEAVEQESVLDVRAAASVFSSATLRSISGSSSRSAAARQLD